MKELFTIGEIGKLFNMNIRTLRYYDEIGLLKPEKIQEKTGYRYYSTRQFERLNTIKYLRALDMPLTQIIHYFEHMKPVTIIKLLQEQREEISRRMEALQQMDQKICSRLSQIDDAIHSTLNQVEEIHIKTREITLLRREILRGDDLEYPIRELERVHALQGTMFLGKVGVSISQKALCSKCFGSFSSIFVFLEEGDRYQGEAESLIESDYARIRYSGTHAQSDVYYEKLIDYMKENHLVISGGSVEVTLIDSGMTDNPWEYVTELQIPFKRT